MFPKKKTAPRSKRAVIFEKVSIERSARNRLPERLMDILGSQLDCQLIFSICEAKQDGN
jgi:hypothetical protein